MASSAFQVVASPAFQVQGAYLGVARPYLEVGPYPHVEENLLVEENLPVGASP